MDTEGIIIKPIAPNNEYVTSQPDLLIFHTNNVETLNCLYVQTGTDDDDDDASSLNDVKVTGFAGEFKGNAENECLLQYVWPSGQPGFDGNKERPYHFLCEHVWHSDCHTQTTRQSNTFTSHHEFQERKVYIQTSVQKIQVCVANEYDD